MQIRKNTKAFKTIVQIIGACQERPDREKLVRLYVTRAGSSIEERINVEGIQGDAAVFYEMNYQSILINLSSSSHQLQMSDDLPGIYFFHSSRNKIWDETPFEFDDAIKKEFSDLPELPVTRKKEKIQKYEFPAAPAFVKTKVGKAKPVKEKKEKEKPSKATMFILRDDAPKQPDYKLRHKIYFNSLDRVITRQPLLTRKDIFDYYNKISEYILPYLKDRPLLLRLHNDHAPATEYTHLESLQETSHDIPDWIKTYSASKGKSDNNLFMCNDKEHLLFYNEIGAHEFHTWHSRTKSINFPDYIVLVIDSPEHEIGKAIPVTLTVKTILDGLKLPSFVKTNGQSGLHVYIPFDSKSKYNSAFDVAQLICRLVALKIPNDVSLGESEEYAYGKVSLNYVVNEEGKTVIAPYSLLPGNSAAVATPLLWDEVTTDLRIEDFNHESIFKRLKQTGDPFENLFKKKVNGDDLLKHLEENYGFLLRE